MIPKGYLGPIDTDCAGDVRKFIRIIYCRTCFEIDDRAFDWLGKILLLSDRQSLRSIRCEVWNRNFILKFFRNFGIEFVTLLRLHCLQVKFSVKFISNSVLGRVLPRLVCLNSNKSDSSKTKHKLQRTLNKIIVFHFTTALSGRDCIEGIWRFFFWLSN